MAQNTPISGLTYPELADPPNLETAVKTPLEQIDGLLIPRYASVTAADAANVTPEDGQVRYVTGVGLQQRVAGSTWAPLAGKVVCQLRQTAAQTLTAGVLNPITFTTEDLDLLSGHSTSSQTSRYTPPVPGWYGFSSQVGYAGGSADSSRYCGLLKNGSAVAGSGTQHYSLQLIAQTVSSSMVAIQMNGTTDYVEVYGSFSSGTQQTQVASAQHQSRMTVVYLGPS